jgi:hypothetical protein
LAQRLAGVKEENAQAVHSQLAVYFSDTQSWFPLL